MRASANGKMRFRRIEDWVESVMEARRALHVTGFVAINGKTLQGKALYVKSKASSCSICSPLRLRRRRRATKVPLQKRASAAQLRITKDLNELELPKTCKTEF